MAATWSSGSPMLLRFHSQRKSERLQKLTHQFKATQLWNNIIVHLRAHVGIKRRRHMMKYYDNCFTGSEAVDVILRHLLDDNENFGKADISREKAVKLCQAFMDNNVFEPVQIKSGEDKKLHFEDNTAKFYRFTIDSKEKENVSENLARKDPRTSSRRSLRKSLPNNTTSQAVIRNPVVVNQRGQIIQDILKISDAVQNKGANIIKTLSPHIFGHKKRPSICSVFDTSNKDDSITKAQRIESPALIVKPVRNRGGRVPIHPGRRPNIPREVQDAIEKEIALASLLSIIDLPILDGILAEVNRNDSGDTVIENAGFNVTRQSFRYKDWMTSALDCLENIPAGTTLVTSMPAYASANQHKWRLYKTIADYYSTRPTPLLSDRLSDIYVALIDLMERTDTKCLKAFQLTVLLLSPATRKELKCLLTFMNETIHEDTLRIHQESSNRSTVKSTFSSAILKNGPLSGCQTSTLVMYMVHNCDRLFQVPREVKRSVRLCLSQRKSLGSLDTIFESSHCVRVTLKQYQQEQLDYTNKSLCKMMDAILDNVSISLKEKKARLKQFQKHHPLLYSEHFSHMEW